MTLAVKSERVKSPATNAAGPRWLVRGLSLLIVALLWRWASTTGLRLPFVSFALLPSPDEVWRAFLDMASSGKLAANVASSLARVLSGYAAAALLGVALGALISRHRIAEDILLPSLELARPIPAVAWIPLAILMFPSSEASMMFIICTGALFPILLATIHAVREVDERLITSARTLGASETTIVLEVVLPAALPGVFTGLSIGMGTSWFCLVTAEMISGQSGVGYHTWESYTVQNYPDIVVGMLLIGLLGSASSASIRAIGALVMPWRRAE
jgi:NitT/TauT family transport system permease protein